MKRRLLLISIFGAAVIAAAPTFYRPKIRVVYNATDSAPLGWYWVTTSQTLHLDDYVIATLPNDVAILAATRHYLPLRIPILKRIGALPPQCICIRSSIVHIDNVAIAAVLSADAQGRPLVPWPVCERLKTNQIFLFNPIHPASFDSRYFGPITTSAVRGKAIPIWTWSRQ